MTKKCIFCYEDKDESEFSLEHVIPQFLGGAYVDNSFKTRDVCRKCNSNLGLFVDAAFEKSWHISVWLQSNAVACYSPSDNTSIPLVCMGLSDFQPPHIQADEVCEVWLGPMGEQVYWVRAQDESLYWYTGGNPIQAKSIESRAYFFFSEQSSKQIELTWVSFRDAFKKFKRVKKIMCTEVYGADINDIGFSIPDDVDKARIGFFRVQANISNGLMHNKIPINVKFDIRFMSKLALGVAYCLFGKKILQSSYTEELRKGTWFKESKEDIDSDMPKVHGKSLFSGSLGLIPEHMLEKNAVTIIITTSAKGVALSLNLDKSYSSVVLCADSQDLTKEDIERVKDGIVILIYKYLHKSVMLTLPEYLSYKLGHSEHEELASINESIIQANQYFKNL